MIPVLVWGGRVVTAALFVSLIGGVRAHGGDSVSFHVAFGLSVTLVLILAHALGMVQSMKLVAPLRELERSGAEFTPEIAAAIPQKKEIVRGPLFVVALAVVGPIVALMGLDGQVPRWTHGAIQLATVALHIWVWQGMMDGILRARMIIDAIESELSAKSKGKRSK